MLNVIGAVLLLVGAPAAFLWARVRQPDPGPAWFPDPATDEARQRWWDGHTWTGQVVAGGQTAARGRRFRGRFWGRWAWYLVVAVVALSAGFALYLSTGEIHVLAVASFVGMAGIGWAFYRFVNHQLDLDAEIGQREVLAVAVATSGAVLLIAANINSLLINGPGVATATAAVGVVEEGTKFLVPIGLYLLGRYRSPRTGTAIGLAAGIGFAVTEVTRYAYQTATATGPDFCGTVRPDPTPASVVFEQTYRIFMVEPLHWLWTGIAVTIAWRLWHLYGRRGTWGALGGLLAVMVIHSLNDSAATAFCHNPAASGVAIVVKWALLPVMYVVVKSWARKSTPPTLIGKVSRGWAPHHLPVTTGASGGDEASGATDTEQS